MRILVVADTYPPQMSGVSRFTYQLTAGLGSRGHAVHVIVPSQLLRQAESVSQDVTLSGIRSLRSTLYPLYPLVAPFLRAAMSHRVHMARPDVIVIQSHFLLSRVASAVSANIGIPIVGVHHFLPENLAFMHALPMFARAAVAQHAWWDARRILKNVDVLVTPTKTAANILRQQGFSGDIRVISCGVDTERFHPRRNGERLRRRYGIPSGPTLLYVGRLEPEKRIDVAIAATAHLRKTMPVHLVIAGRGAEERKLRAQVEMHNAETAVTFAGFVPDADLPDLYRIADVFIMLGMAELQSIATLEALASGLPVVGMNATALGELIHDGENGILLDGDDPRAYALAVQRLLTDPARCRSLGQRSRAIAEMHNITKTLAVFEELVHSLLRRREMRL